MLMHANIAKTAPWQDLMLNCFLARTTWGKKDSGIEWKESVPHPSHDVFTAHLSIGHHDSKLHRRSSCNVQRKERNIPVEDGVEASLELGDQISQSFMQQHCFLLPKRHEQLVDNANEVWPAVTLRST